MTDTPVLYLIHRSETTDGVINGVTGVIMTMDSTVQTTDALRIAKAIEAVNAQSPSDVADGAPATYDASYFDTVQVLALTPTGGVLSVEKASIILQDSQYGGVSAVQTAVT